MLYVNKGYVQGTLARDPYKVAEGVVLLTLRVRDDRINPTTGRRDFHYPTFVVFGRESDKALNHLVRRQEVAIEYKLETRSKVIDGEEDTLRIRSTQITYGRRPRMIPMVLRWLTMKLQLPTTTTNRKTRIKNLSVCLLK